MVNLVFIFLSICFIINSVTSIFVIEKNTTSGSRSRLKNLYSPTDWTDVAEDGLWSSVLEDWTLSQSDSNRQGKIYQPNHHKYIPTNAFYITKRVGEAYQMELEPNLRSPGKVISPPVIGAQQPTVRQNYGNMSPSPREVSETDLYLLGAIEKLVYRVDYMEKRLRRTEQLIYYLMAGNNQNNRKEDPCPENFTRVSSNCYHFGTVRDLNWKSANAMCKSLGAQLAEFEDLNENQDISAFLLNHPHHRGKDFWLGGLNPGLLWIWSNSAKPVNPNANLTSISNASLNSNNNFTLKINSSKTTTKPTTTTKSTPKPNGGKVIINNTNHDVRGTGRCLRFSYNPALHIYSYTGEECALRYNYLCEYKDRTLDNEISRIAKDLKLPN